MSILDEYFEYQKAIEECKSCNSVLEVIENSAFVFLSRSEKIKLILLIIKTFFK